MQGLIFVNKIGSPSVRPQHNDLVTGRWQPMQEHPKSCIGDKAMLMFAKLLLPGLPNWRCISPYFSENSPRTLLFTTRCLCSAKALNFGGRLPHAAIKGSPTSSIWKQPTHTPLIASTSSASCPKRPDKSCVRDLSSTTQIQGHFTNNLNPSSIHSTPSFAQTCQVMILSM